MIESFSSLSPVPVFPLSCDARAGDLSCHDEAIEFSWSLCPAHASPPSCDARAGDLSCHDEAIEFSWSLSPALASPASSFSFFVPPTDDLSFHDESFGFAPPHVVAALNSHHSFHHHRLSPPLRSSPLLPRADHSAQ